MTMSLAPFQVRCPSCHAEYPVDPDRVPAQGVHAVCSGCLRTFPVQLPDSAEGLDDEGSAYTAPQGVDASSQWAAPAPSPTEVEGPPPPDDMWADSLPTVDPVAPPGRDELQEVEPSPVEGSAPPEAPPMEPPPATDAPPMERPAPEAPPVEPEVERTPPTRPGSRAKPDPALHDLSNLTEEALSEQEERAEATGGVDRAALSRGAARFGKRDPHDRARRLARVLVSDIIAYYPEKHAEAVLRGSVREEFEAEVQKSWKEYVDQVGSEIADSTPYFREALNEVLARGREIY